MIAVDTQILIYAHRAESPWHAAATAALDALNGQPWAIPWPCIHEFMAIATHAKVFDPPSPLADATAAVESWLNSDVILLGETEDHWSTLCDLVKRGKVAGPLVHDARIAAICVQHAVHELWTADRDFTRFPAVQTRNPLVS